MNAERGELAVDWGGECIRRQIPLATRADLFPERHFLAG